VGIIGWSGSIENCIISGNSSYEGGGLADCTGPITGCLITGNEGVMPGGGLYNCSGAISNCTIAGNTAWKDDESGELGLGGGLLWMHRDNK
jgi:hypothetical protein